jgi:hypothetical protein
MRKYYRFAGVFVIDSRGDVWQTFGAGLLNWYRSTEEHVMDACLASLRELAISYHLSAGNDVPMKLKTWLEQEYPEGNGLERARLWFELLDGPAYYVTLQMPSLMRIPMPVTATWSVKEGRPDQYNVRPRRHYPQLSEPGFHDPDMHEISPELMYASSEIPSWLVMPRLSGTNAEELIREDPEVASVRYVQDFSPEPTFFGGLAILGAGYVSKGPTHGSTYALGLGFGIFDQLLRTQYLPTIGRFSFELLYQPEVGDSNRSVITASWAVQLRAPRGFGLHLEAGTVWGLQAPFTERGSQFAIGAAAPSIGVPFAYAGMMVRVKYQWLDMEHTIGGISFELVLH